MATRRFIVEIDEDEWFDTESDPLPTDPKVLHEQVMGVFDDACCPCIVSELQHPFDDEATMSDVLQRERYES